MNERPAGLAGIDPNVVSACAPLEYYHSDPRTADAQLLNRQPHVAGALGKTEMLPDGRFLVTICTSTQAPGGSVVCLFQSWQRKEIEKLRRQHPEVFVTNGRCMDRAETREIVLADCVPNAERTRRCAAQYIEF